MVHSARRSPLATEARGKRASTAHEPWLPPSPRPTVATQIGLTRSRFLESPLVPGTDLMRSLGFAPQSVDGEEHWVWSGSAEAGVRFLKIKVRRQPRNSQPAPQQPASQRPAHALVGSKRHACCSRATACRLSIAAPSALLRRWVSSARSWARCRRRPCRHHPPQLRHRQWVAASVVLEWAALAGWAGWVGWAG